MVFLDIESRTLYIRDMRIFVTGGTGVIGRPTVQRLVAAGHDVTVVARTPERAEQIRLAGATPARVDLFDATGLRAAVAGHDAVLNLATHVPPPNKASNGDAWAENERIRREASGHLVDAALAAGASVFVQESLAFAYADGGDEWLDEASPLLEAEVAAGITAAEASVARFAREGGRGVALRFGRFYDPASNYSQLQVRLAGVGVSSEVGAADGYQPLIAIHDAADAVVAALDAPSGVYNVVDTAPLTRREIDTVLAGAVGRKRLWRPMDHLPRNVGPDRTLFEGSNRVSNRRYVEASGWRPSPGGSAAGLRRLVRELGYGDRGLRGLTRALLWILGLSGLVAGVQALFAPQYFYDEFPFGRGWVALDPPFNEHLLRDVGAFYLALTVITFVALVMRSPLAARLSALAWLVFSVPHGIYHAAHLHHVGTADAVGIVIGTAGPALLALFVLLLPAHTSASSPSMSAFDAPSEPRSFSVPA
jgi:nucleoside-diphosphate-sugar epimerase